MRKIFLLLGGATTVSLACPAIAQTAPLAAPAGRSDVVSSATLMNDIIVTARRREETNQTVPIAITALSGDFLENKGIAQLTDLNAYVPSFQVSNFNTPVKLTVAIRGQRQSQVIPGQDPSVGLYVGDISWSYPLGVGQQMYDLSSLQVLKGPQGTLFGKNTTGGAMIVMPALPGDKFEGYVSVRGMAFGHGHGVGSTGMLNVPISDAFSIRAAYDVIDRDGYIENMSPIVPDVPNVLPFTRGENSSDERNISARLTALLKPSDNFENVTRFSYTRFRGNGIGWHLTAVNPNSFAALLFPDLLPEFADLQRQYDRDFYSSRINTRQLDHMNIYELSNTTTWHVTDDITIKNIIGYRDVEHRTVQDLDGSSMSILSAPQYTEGHEFSEELQLLTTFLDDRIDLTTGIYYADQDLRHQSGAQTFGTVNTRGNSRSVAKTYSAYAQAGIGLPVLNDRLSATIGLRYTKDKRSMTLDSIDPYSGNCAMRENDGITPLDPCGLSGSKNFRKLTYTLGLDFQVDSQTLIYLASRKGYRAGGFNVNATSPLTFTPFDPEIVTDYEIGLKKTWQVGTWELRTNLAGYYQKYKGIQRFVVPPDAPAPNVFYVANAADAEIWGGEAEVSIQPTRELTLSGSFSIVKPKYGYFADRSGDFTRNKFAQVPEYQYTLGANYVTPTSLGGDLRFGVDWSHQSSIKFVDTSQGPFFGPISTQGERAYGILNMQIGWDRIADSNFDVSLQVKNALQTHYRASAILLYGTLGTNVATIGDPRVFSAELTYRF